MLAAVRRFKALFCVTICAVALLAAGVVSAASGGDELADVLESARLAGVPDEELNRFLALGRDYDLDESTVAGFIRIVNSVQKEAVPRGPFWDKIEEGLAKRVTPVRIEAVLLRKLDDYRFAREVMEHLARTAGTGEPYTPDQLIVLGETLSMGISREALSDFLRHAPSAPLPMSLIAAENFALLHQIGFDPELTRELLGAGLAAQCFTPRWRYLSRVVAAAQMKGESDAFIADTIRRVIRDKKDFNDLMDGLGFTGRDMQAGPVGGGSGTSAEQP